jgi:hypothetical protein
MGARFRGKSEKQIPFGEDNQGRGRGIFPRFGTGRGSCRKDGGKGAGRVDFAGLACYCEKVAMASRVFGRQEEKTAIHWKSNYTARLSGFLTFWSGR